MGAVPDGKVKVFDVEKLASYAQEAINIFAAAHEDETFYAFSIAGSWLSLNSEEALAETLASYQERYPSKYDPGYRTRIKNNSGDWEYQGFAEFSQESGFDIALHDEHYNLHFPLAGGETVITEYSLAMGKVMRLLVQRDAFGPLKRTNNFSISRTEYD